MPLFNSMMDLVEPCSFSLAIPFPSQGAGDPGSLWNRFRTTGPCRLSREHGGGSTGAGKKEMQPGCSMRVDLATVMLPNSPLHRTAGEKTGKMEQKEWGGWEGRKLCFHAKKKPGILGRDHLRLSVVLALLFASPKPGVVMDFLFHISH